MPQPPLKANYASTLDPLTPSQMDLVASAVNAGCGFTHTQSTPAATWTVNHTLGRYPKSVTVIVSNFEVLADVETPSTTQVVITFATAQSGRAEII
jgi:hypothetical protein